MVVRFRLSREPGQPQEVAEYAVVLRYLDARGRPTAVRVYDNAHGEGNPEGDHHMHRCDRRGRAQQPPEIFHWGNPGEALRTARYAVEEGFEGMIDGWRR